MSADVTRGVRVWVYGLLALLCIPGVIGFDLWPLTGWRLFSLARSASQSEWALDARTAEGIVPVDLEQLPLAFRNAAWPLNDLLDASRTRRQEVCEAMLDAVGDLVTDARSLVLVFELHRLREGAPMIEQRFPVQECGAV